MKDLDGAPGGLSDILVTNELDGSVWAFQNTTVVFGSSSGTALDNPRKSAPEKEIQVFKPGRGGVGRDEETTGSSDDDGVDSGSASSPFGVGITMTWTSYDTPSGSAPADLAVADFDNDGNKDIATANEGGDSISILMGTGGGAYGPATTFLVDSSEPPAYTAPISIAAGDLDDDGDIDLTYVAALTGTGTVSRVLRNTLSGGSYGWVIESLDSLDGQDPYLIRTADVDNDGDDDVIALVLSPALTDSGPVFGFSSTQMEANDPEDSSCPADFDNSGSVDGVDLALLLGEWGDCPILSLCLPDINNDNRVDGADLAVLLGEWGACHGGAPPLE